MLLEGLRSSLIARASAAVFSTSLKTNVKISRRDTAIAVKFLNMQLLFGSSVC